MGLYKNNKDASPKPKPFSGKPADTQQSGQLGQGRKKTLGELLVPNPNAIPKGPPRRPA